MKTQVTFEQYWGHTAGGLDLALKHLDAGNIDEAHTLIAAIQRVNSEQAEVIDPRIYGAIRHLCESRDVDSRRLVPLLLTLGFREIVRSLLMSKTIDVIKIHEPIENDFFIAMLGQIPTSPELGELVADDYRTTGGVHRSSNARRWDLFCQMQGVDA